MAGRATKSLSQSDKKRLLESIPNITKAMAEFGTDRKRNEFTLEVIESLDRFGVRRRDNLFAIVMPSGAGKTGMCNRFGFIDIDVCSTPDEHDLLNKMRLDCLNGKQDWIEHNNYWLSLVNGTLDMLDLSKDTVIMVHSEIIALNIGATPLVGLCPDDTLFNMVYSQKVAAGNRPGAMLTALNRAEFLSHSNVVMKTKRTFSSFDEMEKLVIRTLLVNEIAVACPYKYGVSIKPVGYADDLPDWIYSGDKSKVDTKLLVELFDSNMVPKVCMDYFMKGDDIPASFGFGLKMNEWAVFMAMVRSATTDHKDFDIGSDMADVFPYLYSKNETRANVTMQRLVKGLDVLNNADVYDIVGHHVGKPNNFVSAVVCYWLGIASELECRVTIKKMLGVSYRLWTSIFKEFHSLIRLSRFFMNTEISEMERQKLMYINLLVGKEIADANWEDEVVDRSVDSPRSKHLSYNANLGLWTEEQYWRDFCEAVDTSYTRMNVNKVVNISGFNDFYERRANWLTKGSTVFTKLDADMKIYTQDMVNEVGDIVGAIRGRHNKKSLFEVSDVIKELGEDFEMLNVTKIVTKLDECGHAKRALFPGSLLHYIIFCYVLYFPEQQGQVGNVRLNAPADDSIEYFERKMGSIPHLLFDWVNYNSYHSQDEMALVIQRLGEVVPGPSDYAMFCTAIAASMYHMWFVDPEGGLHRLGQGLYSGWRGTTWINTCLNYNYIYCAEMSFMRLYGRQPFRYIDGGGDDLDAGLNRPEDGYILLAIMKKMKFKGKEIKQMLDNKAEFFRNTISSSGAFASPTRALATFVNGKWEGSGLVPIKERIGGILDQVSKVARRGMNRQFANSLAVICLSHWCRLSSGSSWMSVPAKVMHGHPDDNGLGVPDREGRLWRLDPKVPEPKVIEEPGSPPGSLASMDYLSTLCRELSEFNIDIAEVSRRQTELARASFDIYEKYDYTPILTYEGQVIDKVPAVEPRENKVVFEVFTEHVKVYKRDKEMARLMRYAELLPDMVVGERKITIQELCEVLGCRVDPKIFEFKGDIYYRRMVSEPIAKCITDFCLDCVGYHGYTVRQAEDIFKILCWMCYTQYEFHI